MQYTGVPFSNFEFAILAEVHYLCELHIYAFEQRETFSCDCFNL